MFKKNWFKLALLGLLLVMTGIGATAVAFTLDGNSTTEPTQCDQLVESSAWIIEVDGGAYYTNTEPTYTEEGFLLVSGFCRVYDNGDTRQGLGDIINGDWIIYPRSAE